MISNSNNTETLMTLSILRFAVLTALTLCGSAAAQVPDAAQMKELAAKMAKISALGPHHAALGQYVGRWDVEIAFSGAMMPAQRSKGTAEYSWIIEGRWLGQRIKGQMLGRPYESFSIVGYDTFSKNRVAVTVGSTDSSMNVVRGLWADPNEQATAMYGTLEDFISGELHKPFKVVNRNIDANRHVTEIWEFGGNDSGVKVMEFTFTRAK
jgi:hypothetical protein